MSSSFVHHSLCYCLPVFNPFKPYRVLWNILVIAALLISCVEIPVTLAFGPTFRDSDLEDGLTISLLAIDVLLCIDILITLRTGYYDKNKDKYIDDPVDIAKKYVRFWFFVDFMTSFPFAYVTSEWADGVPGYTDAINLIRLFRLIRLVRLSRLIDLTRRASSFPPGFIYKVNIAKILFLMIYIAHCFACLFYIVGEWAAKKGGVENTWIIKEGLDGDGVTDWERYSTSLYWAVITLFTTGYGDIVATNIYEQWVCILCVFLGSCVSAGFIGSFSALIMEGDTTQRSEHEALERAQAFCNHYNIDDKLRRAMELHTRYYYKRHNYWSDTKDEVLQCLPSYLQTEIKKKLAMDSMKHNTLFKGLDDAVIGSLMLNVKSVACNEKCSLFTKNEVANELYICTQGTSQLLRDDEGSESDLVKRKYIVSEGDIVGEYCLSESYRKYTLRCNTWSEFWRIGKCDIHDCIFQFYGKKKGEKKWNEMITKLKGKRKRRKVKLQSRGWQQKIFRDREKKRKDFHDDMNDDDNGYHDFREDEELKQMEIEMLEIPQSEEEVDFSYDEWSESSRRGNLFRNDKPNLGKSFLKLFQKKKKVRNKANELVQRAHSRHKEYAAASSDTSHSDEHIEKDKNYRIEISECENKIDGEDHDKDIINDINTYNIDEIDHKKEVSLPSNAIPDKTNQT